MKYMPLTLPKNWHAHRTLLSISGSALASALASGCQLTSFLQTASERRADSARFDTGGEQNLSCNSYAPSWQVSGQVQKAELLVSGNKTVLVYNSFTRSGPKTVWQPLNEKREIQEAGVVVGARDVRSIADFRVIGLPNGNSLFSYRAKPKNRETNFAHLEHLIDSSDKLIQTKIPLNKNESVQKIWVMPVPKKNLATVVIRVNKYNFGDRDDEGTVYRWFQWDTLGTKLKSLAEHETQGRNLSDITFVTLEKTNEPIAIGFQNPESNFESVTPGFERAEGSIIISRIFSKNSEEVTVYKTKALVTQLSAQETSIGQFLISWISEDEAEDSASVKWIPLAFETTAAGYKKLISRYSSSPSQAPLEPFKQGFQYNALNLQFMRFPFLKTSTDQLMWWAKSEDDSGLVIMPVLPQPTQVTVRRGNDEFGKTKDWREFPSYNLLAPNKNDRIIGLTEDLGGKGKSVVLFAKPTAQRQIETGSLIDSCEIVFSEKSQPEQIASKVQNQDENPKD